MKCFNCGQDMIRRNGFSLSTKVIGDFTFQNLPAYHCISCGEKLIPASSVKEADLIIRQQEIKAIGSIPVGQFLTLNEAARKLGISKQAFQKNKRIKNGFVFSILKGNSYLYDAKSVELFRNSNDGRYLLIHSPEPARKANYPAGKWQAAISATFVYRNRASSSNLPRPDSDPQPTIQIFSPKKNDESKTFSSSFH